MGLPTYIFTALAIGRAFALARWEELLQATAAEAMMLTCIWAYAAAVWTAPYI
jgi:hypothetical protein